MTTLIIIILAIIGGLAESQGYVHASKVWDKGKLVWNQVVISSFGYVIGTILLFVVIRFLQDAKIFSAELQTIIWFAATMLGVALVSGKFFSWPLTLITH